MLFYTASLLDCYALCQQVPRRSGPAAGCRQCLVRMWRARQPGAPPGPCLMPSAGLPAHVPARKACPPGRPPALPACPASTQEGARIVSNSYGSDGPEGAPGYSQLEYEAIQALGQAGALFVAAAGNGGPCRHAAPCCAALRHAVPRCQRCAVL